MKRKLMTWEKFEETFKPLADKWIDNGRYNRFVYKVTNCYCYIKDRRKYFGSEIEVRELKDYYKDIKTGYIFHKSWFEPEFKTIEFLSKEEMEIT